jgi:cell division protein FtsL
MFLVSSQYQARRLFIDLDTAQLAQRKLDIEWNQLQLDQATWSKHGLIEMAARRDLQMQPATPNRTQYITLPTGSKPAMLIEAKSPEGSAR